MSLKQQHNRRNFLKSTGLLGAGLLVPNINLASNGTIAMNDGIHQFGKREGFTDQISILVSMMDWMRATVLRSVDGLSQKELDFLLDEESNSIGAMLLHLGATERFYQIHTFDGRAWGDFDKKDTDQWEVASRLGQKGREIIKGNPLSYYTDNLEKVRERTKKLLKERDDSWLMESTMFFGNEPTNNYCKWFHVVEHESNHNGQIKYIKGRMA
ncbi:DUF664 domain-containing protein [Maribacter algicola]|uniref:DUF664 domain-containing protein n=1 Tax=Meishania litoralis TaxID=3434685 RepID=A0ACC7LJC1_9FLAO